jgi:arsenate reductase (thioredoxin)
LRVAEAKTRQVWEDQSLLRDQLVQFGPTGLESFRRKFCDHSKASAISAGTQPGERVHSEVLQVMKAEGIDLTGMKPQFLSPELAQKATLLVTMGCGDACPFVPGLKKLGWPLADPKGKPLEVVRKIRDEVRTRVLALATERNWL